MKLPTIIAGGRDYRPTAGDELWLDTLPISEVICGCATGADAFGEHWAKTRGLGVRRFPADWQKFGKSAGYRRNVQMAEVARAVVLFPGGKGTQHMEDIARERGLIVYKRKVVSSFWLQPTPSFPDGAPQREEFESSSSFKHANVIYDDEWRGLYKCVDAHCQNSDCPDHHPTLSSQ